MHAFNCRNFFRAAFCLTPFLTGFANAQVTQDTMRASYDIVGIRLGANMDQALELARAASPKGFDTVFITNADKTIKTGFSLQCPRYKQCPGFANYALVVFAPEGKVMYVRRNVSYIRSADSIPPLASDVIPALRKKYPHVGPYNAYASEMETVLSSARESAFRGHIRLNSANKKVGIEGGADECIAPENILNLMALPGCSVSLELQFGTGADSNGTKFMVELNTRLADNAALYRFAKGVSDGAEDTKKKTDRENSKAAPKAIL